MAYAHFSTLKIQFTWNLDGASSRILQPVVAKTENIHGYFALYQTVIPLNVVVPNAS